MAGNPPQGVPGPPPSGFPSSSSNGSNLMPRRSSYASVVAGAGAGSVPASASQLLTQPPSTTPSALSHLMSRASRPLGPPQPYQPTHHARTGSRRGSDGDERMGGRAQEARPGLELWHAAEVPAYSRQFKFLFTGSASPGVTGFGPDAFLTPSYLRGSRYIERLAEAHAARLAKQREAPAGHDTNGHSLSTSSSSVNLPKMAPSHRGMTYDIIEKEPRGIVHNVPPLPSRWNEAEKYGGIEIMPDGLEVRFVGPGKTQEHIQAAAVRADHTMSPLCGIYYYEVTIVSRGKEGTIGVGFSSSRVSLNRLPGWEPESWAYHGDDGRSFCCSSTGKDYGPQFEANDVIGCGLNFRTGVGFFTRNGVYLGNAFSNVKGKLYPSIGMKRHGEAIRANFGQSAFVFDIDGMIAKEKADIAMQVDLTSTANLHPPLDETSLIQQLVAQYLAHEGYVEAAEAFAEEVRVESDSLSLNRGDPGKDFRIKEDPDVIHRQQIRTAILEGDIDKAFKHTWTFYPNVLKENEQIYFRMRCMKFIEMIRQCSEWNLVAQGSSGKQTEATNGHRTGGYDDVFEHEMELDDHLLGGAHWEDQMETEETDGESGVDAEADADARAKHNYLLQEAIKYGQVLQSEFRDDSRKEVRKTLEETFSVWAYEDPKKSIVAHLLEPSGRAPVAEELNSAILVSLGQSSTSALERLFQQTEVLMADISQDGGAGAFINVHKDYLQ